MKIKHLLITALALTLGFSGVVSAADGKKYKWRLAETWGANFPIFGDATKNMAKMVDEMSDGRLTIRIDSSNKHKSALVYLISSKAANIKWDTQLLIIGRVKTSTLCFSLPFPLE